MRQNEASWGSLHAWVWTVLRTKTFGFSLPRALSQCEPSAVGCGSGLRSWQWATYTAGYLVGLGQSCVYTRGRILLVLGHVLHRANFTRAYSRLEICKLNAASRACVLERRAVAAWRSRLAARGRTKKILKSSLPRAHVPGHAGRRSRCAASPEVRNVGPRAVRTVGNGEKISSN